MPAAVLGLGGLLLGALAGLPATFWAYDAEPDVAADELTNFDEVTRCFELYPPCAAVPPEDKCDAFPMTLIIQTNDTRARYIT